MKTSESRAGQGGILLVMTGSTLWGTSGVASQLLANLAHTTPLSIGCWRLLVASPILLAAGWALLGPKMWPASRRDFGSIALVGVCLAVDQALYFMAIKYIGITIATLVVICCAPLLVTLFTSLRERQAPTRFMVSIIVVALAGTALLVTGSSHAGDASSPLLGLFCAVGSGFGYAGVLLLSRFLSARYHTLQITALGFTTGAICLLVVSQIIGFVATYPAAGWLVILYLGAVPTALAYGLFVFGMRTTPAPLASILVLLEPLTAAVLSWWVFGERLSPAGILGAILVVGAIYALSTASR
ncbi:MAG: EamA family transporter [Anaerolineae bacterium]|nr:EamA family transporter [Anaerolineae bacterium]